MSEDEMYPALHVGMMVQSLNGSMKGRIIRRSYPFAFVYTTGGSEEKWMMCELRVLPQRSAS